VEISRKAVWPAPEGLKDSDGRPITSKSGHALTIVRVEITSQLLKKGGTFMSSQLFTPSQLRVVCKQKNGDPDLLAGKGINIYPVGYLKTANELQIKKLNDRIEIKRSDLDSSGVKKIDFAFYVPDGFVPVLVEFKQNSINQLPPPVTTDQAPDAAPFIPPPQRTEGAAGSPAPATDVNVEDTNKKDTAESPATDKAEDATDSNSTE
jgi:hypothetical protein